MEYKTIGQLKVPQNLDPEKQKLVDEIASNYLNELADINAEATKGKTRGAVGSLISGASFHPFFNIPYVGTGIGGAMYDAGQGIVEGEKLPEIAKRAGRGFVIGETVGAVPYVGRLASKTKAGQAGGKALDEAAEKFAQTKAYDALLSEFAPVKETYKKVILEPQRKMQQQRLIGAEVNPFAKSGKDVLGDSIENAPVYDNIINSMRKELPKYIDVEVEKPALMGGVRSNLTENNKQQQMLNTLYNIEQAKGSVMPFEELKNRFPTRADEELQKIYDAYINKNYEVIKPFEAAKKVTEQHINPEYRPLYKQSSNNDIIDFYNSMSDTDKIGHGYKGYSMSNNAATAYDRGNMPLSKWSKENILNRIKEIGLEFDIPINEEVLKKMPFKELKEQFLQKNGYHHTSKFYNSTDFYKVNIEKLLEQAEK